MWWIYLMESFMWYCITWIARGQKLIKLQWISLNWQTRKNMKLPSINLLLSLSFARWKNKPWKALRNDKMDYWNFAFNAEGGIKITINNFLMCFSIWIYAFNPYIRSRKPLNPRKQHTGLKCLWFTAATCYNQTSTSLEYNSYIFFRHLQLCI